jgi:hypothetical protein
MTGSDDAMAITLRLLLDEAAAGPKPSDNYKPYADGSRDYTISLPDFKAANLFNTVVLRLHFECQYIWDSRIIHAK